MRGFPLPKEDIRPVILDMSMEDLAVMLKATLDLGDLGDRDWVKEATSEIYHRQQIKIGEQLHGTNV